MNVTKVTPAVKIAVSLKSLYFQCDIETGFELPQ